MENNVKLSHAVKRYTLFGFMSLSGGVLKLYEDKIELSRLIGSVTIELSELDYIKPTRVTGFLPWGLEFYKKSGEVLRIYFTNLFVASSNRKTWLNELKGYVK